MLLFMVILTYRNDVKKYGKHNVSSLFDRLVGYVIMVGLPALAGILTYLSVKQNIA